MKLGRGRRTACWEWGEDVDPSGCCLLVISTTRPEEAEGLEITHCRGRAQDAPGGVITAFKGLKGKDLEEDTCLLGVFRSGRKVGEG